MGSASQAQSITTERAGYLWTCRKGMGGQKEPGPVGLDF